MKALNRKNTNSSTYTEKVIQFGEGNFLRAFVDWMIQEMNEQADFDASVLVVQPIKEGLVNLLNDQDGLYHVQLNGVKKGKHTTERFLIDCISKGVDPHNNFKSFMKLAEIPTIRYIVSNTTEAGISYSEGSVKDEPPASFPAKLTLLLKRRFDYYDGDHSKGVHVLPCELIENNGTKLLDLVLRYTEEWNLGVIFGSWVKHACYFHNTLVDRIVSGYPKEKIEAIKSEINFDDELVVEGEQYGLWVIQGDKQLKEELPATQAGLNVVFASDLAPYRTRKVRILNGAHTAMVPVGYFSGLTFVHEVMQNEATYDFIRSAIFEEIIPTIPLPENELVEYAEEVLLRFQNESLNHALSSISLNSISKFKVRVLPTILDYYLHFNKLPSRLVYSFAALLVYYKGGETGNKISLKDDPEILQIAKDMWSQEPLGLESVVKSWLTNEELWGLNLMSIVGLQSMLLQSMQSILINGVNLQESTTSP